MFDGVDFEALLRPNRDAPQEKSWHEQAGEEVCSLLPSLTWKERVGGCAFCMVVGYLLSFGSFLRMKSLFLGNPFPFVFISTVGNLLSLSGSCFLTGPRSQVTKMFHHSRRIASILYLSSLALTLVVAFTCKSYHWQGAVLVLLLMCQYVAITWYCLSYIPYARQWIKGFCSKWCSDLMEEE